VNVIILVDSIWDLHGGKRGNNFKFCLPEFVQVAVYKLSEAGQAIDGGDYSKATAVLAQQNADWIRDVQTALSKVLHSSDFFSTTSKTFMSLCIPFTAGDAKCLNGVWSFQVSSNPDEKAAADSFRSNLSSLQAAGTFLQLSNV
jgi:hypothetical protein